MRMTIAGPAARRVAGEQRLGEELHLVKAIEEVGLAAPNTARRTPPSRGRRAPPRACPPPGSRAFSGASGAGAGWTASTSTPFTPAPREGQPVRAQRGEAHPVAAGGQPLAISRIEFSAPPTRLRGRATARRKREDASRPGWVRRMAAGKKLRATKPIPPALPSRPPPDGPSPEGRRMTTGAAKGPDLPARHPAGRDQPDPERAALAPGDLLAGRRVPRGVPPARAARRGAEAGAAQAPPLCADLSHRRRHPRRRPPAAPRGAARRRPRPGGRGRARGLLGDEPPLGRGLQGGAAPARLLRRHPAA